MEPIHWAFLVILVIIAVLYMETTHMRLGGIGIGLHSELIILDVEVHFCQRVWSIVWLSPERKWSCFPSVFSFSLLDLTDFTHHSLLFPWLFPLEALGSKTVLFGCIGFTLNYNVCKTCPKAIYLACLIIDFVWSFKMLQKFPCDSRWNQFIERFFWALWSSWTYTW